MVGIGGTNHKARAACKERVDRHDWVVQVQAVTEADSIRLSSPLRSEMVVGRGEVNDSVAPKDAV